MVFKTVLFVCAHALVMQSIAGQCIGAGWSGAGWDGCGLGGSWANAPFGAAGLCGAEFSGGALPVASASAIPPSGVSLLSQNEYAGELVAVGALPFLGTVGLEGVLPTAGAGVVAYGCGNGEVGMLTEGIGAVGFAGLLGYGCGSCGLDGSWANAPSGAAGLCGAEFSSGTLSVASTSAIPPSGVSLLSENVYIGELAVKGALPFLGTVGLEGVLPTAGAGAVAYGCGNGEVGMLTEGIGAAGFAGPLGYGYGNAGLGYGAGIAPSGNGYGCGGQARGRCGCGRAFY